MLSTYCKFYNSKFFKDINEEIEEREYYNIFARKRKNTYIWNYIYSRQNHVLQDMGNRSYKTGSSVI